MNGLMNLCLRFAQKRRASGLLPGRLTCLVCVDGIWLTASGCNALSLTPKLPGLPFGAKKQAGPVSEIMALWQPGEGRDVKGLPSRGFAGQLFFFKQGDKRPCEVEGDIKIYVFDNLGSEDEQRKPIHVYEFKAGAWKSYMTETNIGKAYQVFIPYPRPGDHRAVCTIRVKHVEASGETVLSDPADIILVGKKAKVNVETVISEPRPAIPSNLSTQQTRVASIDRHGKVKSNDDTRDTHPLASQDSSGQQGAVQKNTQVSHYQKQPTPVEVRKSQQSPGVQQVSYQAFGTQGGAEDDDDDAEMTGWSLHRHPEQQKSPAQPRNWSPTEQPSFHLSPNPQKQPVAAAAAKPHPLEESSRSVRRESRTQPEFLHPLEEDPARPEPRKSENLPKTSLKVKTISLE